MTAADEPLRYRRLRAPTEDGTALIEPPIAEASRLVARNRALTADWDHLSGLPFSQWRREARQGLLRLVRDDESEAALKAPLVLTGHQPTLFHPGVWLKNYVLSQIAGDMGGHAVNLVIDNDIVRQASIRVPTGSVDSPRVVEVPLDGPAGEMPWEQRTVQDSRTFASFGQRVRETIHSFLGSGSLNGPLLIDRLWETCSGEHDPQGRNLGSLLASARSRVERTHGLKIADVRLSDAVSGGAGTPQSFLHFLEVLFSRHRELHEIYNQVVGEYRRVNRVRSASHPVPDLTRDGDWYEMPLWLFYQARRCRVFVRREQAGWQLRTIEEGIVADIARVRIRPRAVITTMYARLVLSDLFIHGIGGAKYDELTDAIIRRFFGIEPPAYVTATATVRLPIDRPKVTVDDLRALDQRIRDTNYHPEVFADEIGGAAGAEFRSLAAAKRELVAHGWQEKRKKEWHRKMELCNERMAALLAPLREDLAAERDELLGKLHAARILGSREYSFCLFPEEMLVPLLKKLAGG